jgi:hypothetical protein
MTTTHVATAPTGTERRLAALLDRSEIADLVARSLVAIDEARFDDLRTIYAQDASASAPGGDAEGLDAIVALVARNHIPEDRSQHLVGDVVVDLDGDTARVRANVVAGFAPSLPADPDAGSLLPPPVEVTFGTVYRYGAVRTSDGWRLSRVEIDRLWFSGSPDRLLRRATADPGAPEA